MPSLSSGAESCWVKTSMAKLFLAKHVKRSGSKCEWPSPVRLSKHAEQCIQMHGAVCLAKLEKVKRSMACIAQ
jgi:hypothetical protein